MDTARTVTAMPKEGRALLTEREREILAGEADVTDNYEYKVRSKVRNRILKHLRDDVELLDGQFEEAYDLVVEAVCEYHEQREHQKSGE